jgi:hypothetical protein
MRQLFLFIVAFLVLLTVHAPSQPPVPTPTTSASASVLSEAALRKKLTDTCDQVNAFYKAEHFPVSVPSPDGCSFSYTDNIVYKVKTGKFEQTNASNLNAELLAASGTMIAFFNWNAFDAAYGPDASLFPQMPPPRWTKAHAIEVAAKFADIFVKPWGVKLGQPTTDFYSPGGWPPKVEVGQWIVKWPRVSRSGIPFASNGVNVSLTEEYGPHTIGLGLTADYDDIPITPIPQSSALLKARQGLDKILGWGPAKSWLSGVQLKGNPWVRLLIVQPNDLLAQKSIDDLAFSDQRKARLAWVVTYAMINPTNFNIRAAVSVYIDARDGSFLGGTF